MVIRVTWPGTFWGFATIVISSQFVSHLIQHACCNPVTSAAILDTVVDSLINDVKSILEKPVLDADDAVIVDGRVEICCTTFNDLREGRWLDNWMLMAGIQMSDKPHFIRYEDCGPLDEHSRRSLKPIRKPSGPSLLRQRRKRHQWMSNQSQ